MKSTLKFYIIFLYTILLLLPSCYLHSQIPRSEIIRHTKLIEIKDNSIIETDSIVHQVNERMGENDTKVKILYHKGDKISIGDIWIEDMDGNIVRKIKKNEIEDRSATSYATLYQDAFVKSFEPKHNKYPYKIYYSYSIKSNRYINLVDLNYHNHQTPVNYGKITVIAPNDTNLDYKLINVAEPIIEHSEKSKTYKWIFKHKPEKPQNYGSINSSNAPNILIAPPKFKYGIYGFRDSWLSFGNWVYQLNKNRDILPESEKIKIGKLVEGTNYEIEKIKALYQYLQDNTRYINISTNIGGHQTHPAEYVVINKYGDCKALTNYMQSMLKHVRIESYYTLVHSSSIVVDIAQLEIYQ